METNHPLLDMHLKLKRLYDQQLAPVMEKWQLTRMELDVLLFLQCHPQVTTAAQLVQQRALTKSHVSKAVEHLTACGYLTQQRDERNRRRINLTLTDKAAPILEEGRAAQEKFAAILNQGVDPADRDIFFRVARQVSDNVAAALRS